MGKLSKVLMAFTWARAAMSTSLITTQLNPRDDLTKCPDGLTNQGGYTTQNSLNFTIYCGQNNPGNRAGDPWTTSTMQDCMNLCSRYRTFEKGGRCYGVVWNDDGTCTFRNSNVTLDTLEPPEGGVHFAMAERSNLDPLDTACPADDLSTHTLPSGIGYTVNCGKVINGSETCFSGYPECDLVNEFYGLYHATSLEECLEFCVQEHPLCLAVSYSPNIKESFVNCYLKTGFEGMVSLAPGEIWHSASITSMDRIDTKCPSAEEYTSAQNQKQFEIHCGEINTGTNMTSVHRQNITSCIDACSDQDKCISVVFDSGLLGGYNNCYLQNTTSIAVNKASTTYAILIDKPLMSSSWTALPTGAPSSSPSAKSSYPRSQSWIAGPIVGGIAAFSIAAILFLLYRRHKHKTQAAAVFKQTDPPVDSPYGDSGHMEHVRRGGFGPAEMSAGHEPNEMPVIHEASEMASSEMRPSVKYGREEMGMRAHELAS